MWRRAAIQWTRQRPESNLWRRGCLLRYPEQKIVSSRSSATRLFHKSRLRHLSTTAKPEPQENDEEVIQPEGNGNKVYYKLDRNVNPPLAKIVFLGTSSMAPTKSRNVSSLALHLGGSTWLFDAGEGTQHQIMRCKHVRVTSINKIFITHLHGDHFYGLPGILCALCNSGEHARETPLEIIGPPGLRNLLRTVLEVSAVNLNYRFVVHELHPRERKGVSKQAGTYLIKTRWQDCHPQENPGYDIVANINGEWENIPLSKDTVNDFTVHAAIIKHSSALLTVGFVVEEQDYPGKFLAEEVKLEIASAENQKYLEENGVRHPLRLLGHLKAGRSIRLHDRVVHPSEVLGPKKKGRKFVILGDTYDPSGIGRLAANASVVVHESTNAYLPNVDPGDANVNVTYASVLRKTLSHGHSTPEMAGSFAKAINCKHLILTHLSPRYRYIDSTNYNDEEEESHNAEEAMSLLSAIRACAQTEMTEGRVEVAYDFFEVEIPGNWEKPSLQVREADTKRMTQEDEDSDELSPEESLARAKLNSKRFLAYLNEPVNAENPF